MFTYTLLVLAIYTVVILALVPLHKIAKAQDWVVKKVKQIKDKIDN